MTRNDASHACDACGGTGDANEWRPACSNDAHGEGCGCGDAPLPCPVCFGAGRISDRMPAADALADAETLRLFFWWRAGSTAAYVRSNVHKANRLGEAAIRKGDPAQVVEAARAAFRAVPGLRGE